MDTKKCDDHKQEKKSKIIIRKEEATPLSEIRVGYDPKRVFDLAVPL